MFSVSNSLKSWGSVYYCFHVGGTLLIIFFLAFGNQLKRLHIDGDTESKKIK